MQNTMIVEKYNSAKLVMSSIERKWAGVTAQLINHSGGAIAKNTAQPVTELVIDTRGNSRSIVTRIAYDMMERTPTRRGMAWVCPLGIQEDLVDLSSPMHELLHIYLEPQHFSSVALGERFDGSEFKSIRFEKGFEDMLISQIGYAILSELRNPTSAGCLLVETLACSIGARLLQRFTATSNSRLSSLDMSPNIEIKRFKQVVEYIEENIETNINLDDLAAVAYLSKFHFARSFKQVTGSTPHEYVNNKRIERAKLLLSHNKGPMKEVAETLGFSSQSTFSRAFRQHTGLSPSQYSRHNTENNDD